MSIAPKWIDVSVPTYDQMEHWPDNPPVQIVRMLDMNRGDVCNVSTISMGSHTGTHMDAPVHFLPGGRGIDEMPLDATIGRARIIGIKDKESIKPDELRAHAIQRGERILFKTINSDSLWNSGKFAEDFVFISQDAARYLAKIGILVVGVDYLSVGGFKKDGVETHRALLEAGIWIIEGLNLSSVEPGNYELICLPVKIKGCDGAPARALVRKLEDQS
jgi:arylformamidase